MLDRQLVLKVKGNSYVIEFPNVGKYQNIETMKQILSKGMYSSLMTMGTVSASEALDMVDIEAFLSVLAPQLIKDLKCDSFSELGLLDYKELKDAYQKDFVPWWSNIMELLKPSKGNE